AIVRRLLPAPPCVSYTIGMARESRPPGFDMTYRPQGRESFGPPLRTWILPTLYLVLAIAFVGLVMAASLHTSDSWLFRYIVEGDSHRILGARTLAVLVLLGGIAAMLRTSMRGVVIHPDGVEYRDVFGLSWPKIKNLSWAEIDEIVFESSNVALRSWEGERIWLPAVLDRQGLQRALERVAVARGIPMQGKSLRPIDEIEAELDEMAGGHERAE
ncbi:MAG TPA: PH domain-containing protein, partial [Polyangiaceae bacterium]|nr:PH domain-containing protein [Polyangiaceae bacterium]